VRLCVCVCVCVRERKRTQFSNLEHSVRIIMNLQQEMNMKELPMTAFMANTYANRSIYKFTHSPLTGSHGSICF
jgi:hypothetical protein